MVYVMKERYGCTNPKRLGAFLMEYTMGSRMTAQQPLNNIIRCTIASMSAVLGGANGLIVSSFDEALGLPSPEALGVALRTQQIIAEESGISNTVDPLAALTTWKVLQMKLRIRPLSFFRKYRIEGVRCRRLQTAFIRVKLRNQRIKT